MTPSDLLDDLRNRINNLAVELDLRADVLCGSGDLDMQMIGEHYAGIAEEVRELVTRNVRAHRAGEND